MRMISGGEQPGGAPPAEQQAPAAVPAQRGPVSCGQQTPPPAGVSVSTGPPAARWAVGRLTARPRLWPELALIAAGYWLYTLVRNAVPAHETAAMGRAGWLLDLENLFAIDVELAINRAVAGVNWLAVGANYYYATLHFIVTIGVLVWLYIRRPEHYRPLRTALYATNCVALLGFYFFPLAPPRFLRSDGFIDTVVVYNTWGSWASGDVATASNQYAAMPSLHVGWSLWCAVVLYALTRRAWVRLLAVAYPAVTLFVIVATANHFLLDAVGGAAALWAGFWVQRASVRLKAAVP